MFGRMWKGDVNIGVVAELLELKAHPSVDSLVLFKMMLIGYFYVCQDGLELTIVWKKLLFTPEERNLYARGGSAYGRSPS